MPSQRRAPYDRLWQCLALISTFHPEDVAAWASLPPPEELPSPWTTWTLIALVRQRQRQVWVGKIVKQLGGHPALIAQRGECGHLSRPPMGPVPGMPAWEYHYHGRGCCLTHRVTGEEIDVDFFGNRAVAFDYFFFERYLRSLRAPEPPEQRLIELHPSIDAIRLAFDELTTFGLLAPYPEGRVSSVFRLSKHALRHKDLLDDFCTAWADQSRQPWLAALVGDWLAVHDRLGATVDPSLQDLVAQRVACIRQRRQTWLTKEFKSGQEPRLSLLAMADLGAEECDAFLTRAMRGVISGTTSSALKIVESRDDLRAWCPEVYDLFLRLDPNKPPPHLYLWVRCIHFLLRHGYRKEEVAAALPLASDCVAGDAAVLALEYLPSAALNLFRRGLRSRSRTAAAALALIDQPWSRAELLAVLHESDDWEATCECRLALGESRDRVAWQAVQAWEDGHPAPDPKKKPFIEVSEALFRSAMDELRERISAMVRPDSLTD
jgi:hypothetical protein